MTQAEQQRRRALKAERRRLDGLAQAIAADNPHSTSHPSTRSKQARRNHEITDSIYRRRATYDQMRERMAEIAAELARK